MTNLTKEFNDKIAAARAKPYLIDRLQALQAVEKEVEQKIREQGEVKEGVKDRVESRFLLPSIGLSFAVATAATLAYGGNLGTVIMLGYFSVWVGLGVGVIINGCYRGSERNNSLIEKKYLPKHGETDAAIANAKAGLEAAFAAEFDDFRTLPPDCKAGALRLEELVDAFHEIRREMIRSFRGLNPNPVLEQGSAYGAAVAAPAANPA